MCTSVPCSSLRTEVQCEQERRCQCSHPPESPPLSCARSLSLLRRRAMLRISCTHCWKLCPSVAQPPIHLKPPGPRRADTVASEHSAWFKLLATKWGMAPTGPEEGYKAPLVILALPKNTWLVRGKQRYTQHCTPQSCHVLLMPGQPFLTGIPAISCYVWVSLLTASTKTWCAVLKGQEKITPGAFIPEALVGAFF